MSERAATPRELLARIATEIGPRRPAFFLDYDGTLTPIVGSPEDAVLAPATRSALRRLAAAVPVLVVSGRDREDVAERVGLPELTYAGSHGLDIAGPAGSGEPAGAGLRYEIGADAEPALRAAEAELEEALSGVPGAEVEGKRFALSVHYRRVADAEVPEVERVVDAAVAARPELVKTHAKRVFEVRPRIDWDKGRAVLWLIAALVAGRAGNGKPPEAGFAPVYVGDDLTDEDAFRALDDWAGEEAGRRAMGVLVAAEPRPTAAGHRLRGPDEVRAFLDLAAGRWGRE